MQMSEEKEDALAQKSLTRKQEIVFDRPRTRRFVKEQEELEERTKVQKEEKGNNEPRRSNRDYNVSIDRAIVGIVKFSL